MTKKDKEKRKKQQKSYVESVLYSIIQQSLKEMIDAAMADLLKDFTIK